MNADLLNYPEKALEPQVAYRITSVGMERGLFSGKLSDYIAGDKADYVNARRVIGGWITPNPLLATLKDLEVILRDSLSVENEPPNLPQHHDLR